MFFDVDILLPKAGKEPLQVIQNNLHLLK